MENILYSDIRRTIVQELDPEKIIIFGSYAKNEQTQDSDLDILIVLKKYSFDVHSRLKMISAMRKSLMNINIPKDILIFDETEIDEWENSQNHIIYKALNTGICLYERSKVCA